MLDTKRSTIYIAPNTNFKSLIKINLKTFIFETNFYFWTYLKANVSFNPDSVSEYLQDKCLHHLYTFAFLTPLITSVCMSQCVCGCEWGCECFKWCVFVCLFLCMCVCFIAFFCVCFFVCVAVYVFMARRTCVFV